MNELLQAAKTVIERWDNYSTIMDGQVIYDLRAAVERAETTIRETDAYEHGYIAGQKAMKAHERERIKNIVSTAIPKKMWVYKQAILEKIDVT